MTSSVIQPDLFSSVLKVEKVGSQSKRRQAKTSIIEPMTSRSIPIFTLLQGCSGWNNTRVRSSMQCKEKIQKSSKQHLLLSCSSLKEHLLFHQLPKICTTTITIKEFMISVTIPYYDLPIHYHAYILKSHVTIPTNS